MGHEPLLQGSRHETTSVSWKVSEGFFRGSFRGERGCPGYAPGVRLGFSYKVGPKPIVISIYE